MSVASTWHLSEDNRFPFRDLPTGREHWLSICSAHYVHKSECMTCRAGRWINLATGKTGEGGLRDTRGPPPVAQC